MVFILESIVLFILAVLQSSFLPHIAPWGMVPNLILIAIILITVIEPSRSPGGLFAALIGGFFLDMLSSGIIGVWAISLFAIAIMIKFIKDRYVRVPTFSHV